MTRIWTTVGAALLCASGASAQAVIQIDEDRFVGVGAGLRTSGRVFEVGPAADRYDQSIQLDSIRLYVNAGVHKNFQVEFNTEYDGTGTIEVLDAVVKFAPSPYFNVWMGRHLPPSDRANLAGPFFALGFDYPGLVSGYPFISAGRDNGVMVNGQVGGGIFKYAGGVYDGAASLTGNSTLLWAGRTVVNLLEPEPGYYNNDTYYGEKQLLAVGFAVQRQSEIALTADGIGDFTGMNVDVLFEQRLGTAGVLTLEAAGYKYDFEDGTGPTVVGVNVDGEAFLLAAAYLLPQPMGIGQLQPHVRYQDFNDLSALDLGVHYVIRGHSARISAVYTRTGPSSGTKANAFTFGAQLQF